MRKLLIPMCSALLLASAASSALAAEGGHEYVDDQRDNCLALLKQFDETSTSDANAIALRRQAEGNCLSAPEESVVRGEAEIRAALRMIGRTPPS